LLFVGSATKKLEVFLISLFLFAERFPKVVDRLIDRLIDLVVAPPRCGTLS